MMDTQQTDEKVVKGEASRDGDTVDRKSRRGMKNIKWQDLSGKKRGSFIIRGVIQLGLLVWTLWDLRHRDADQIKGSKRFWTIFAFFQPVGPIAYWLFGRKRKV